MAGLQNIGAGNRDDAFYRYKMPRLMTKIEGRGNGIKTNVVNMVDVAKALARPASYTTKFFGCELGAQSKYDEKTGTSIVNGAHETPKLAGLLEIFIKKYVQCYNCGNPETTVNVSKSQLITLKCAACGYVSDVDMRDKLTTFILRNPPEETKKGKKDKSLKKDKKERQKEGEAPVKVKKELKKVKSQDEGRAQKKKSGSEEERSSEGDEDDEDAEAEDDGVEWLTDASADAAKRRIQEQLTVATSEMVILADDPPPVSPSPKASMDVKSKSSKKSSSPKRGDVAVSPELEEPAQTELPKLDALTLHNILVNEFKELLLKGSSPSQLAASLAEKKEEPPQEVMNAYFEALFGDGFFKGIAKDVAKKKLYLKKAILTEAAQLRLLITLQTFCTAAVPDVGKEIALVLKVLYDDEILEEDQIFEWFDKIDSVDPKTLPVRKYAEPFVDWLRDAEPDDDDE